MPERISELKTLWTGVEIKIKERFQTQTIQVRAALLCVAADIPACRKLCGFKGHSALKGCSKCSKVFPGGVGNRDYSGFNRNCWVPRTKSTHHNHANEVKNANTKRNFEEKATRYGVFYSVLIELDYFDVVRFHVIDPMHNLFLGTAKHVFKMWMKHDYITKPQMAKIDENLN